MTIDQRKKLTIKYIFTKCHRPIELQGRFPSAGERNRVPMEQASLTEVVFEHVLGFTN